MSRLGRALGGGTLRKEARGRGDYAWVLDFKDGKGKRCRHMLSRDKRIAERLKAQIIQQRDLEVAGLASVEGQSRDLSELKTLYLADLQARLRPLNFEKAKQRLEGTLRLIRAQRVRDLKPHMVFEARTQRVKQGAAHSTVNGEVSSLKTMMRWGVRAGLIHENPIEYIPRLSVKDGDIRRNRRALSDEELERFLEAARADDREHADVRAAVRTIEGGTKSFAWSEKPRIPRVPQTPMWRCFLETGARYGELTKSTWGDVDLDKRTLTLRGVHTKSGRTRVIPILAGLANELAALQAVEREVLGRALSHADRLFLTPLGVPWPVASENALRILTRVLKRAGIERHDAQGFQVDIHALRHTFASRLARAGVSSLQLQKLMGHADANMTAKIYTHLQAEDLRGAVEMLDCSDGGCRPVVLRAVR